MMSLTKTEKSEKSIRDILAKYVIGCTKNKTAYIGAIQPIRAKLAQISKRKANGLIEKCSWTSLQESALQYTGCRFDP